MVILTAVRFRKRTVQMFISDKMDGKVRIEWTCRKLPKKANVPYSF